MLEFVRFDPYHDCTGYAWNQKSDTVKAPLFDSKL